VSPVAQPSIRRLDVSAHNVDAQGRNQQAMTVSGNVLPECNASPSTLNCSQLLRIEQELGAQAKYAGKTALKALA
jgi:hypothetical protein